VLALYRRFQEQGAAFIDELAAIRIQPAR